MPQSSEATPSYLGYVHQGYYALVKLLDGTDSAAVAVELDDDVKLLDQWIELHQIKHLSEGASLGIADRGLWKAIGNWIQASKGGRSLLIFATTANLGPRFPCPCLQAQEERDAARLRAAEAVFSNEAERVVNERAAARAEGKRTLPHEERHAGCESFSNLTLSERQELLRRVYIVTESFRIGDIETEVSERLQKFVPPGVRKKLALAVIKWWGFRVVESLRGTRDAYVSKRELQDTIFSLAGDLSRTNLSDTYSKASEPIQWETLTPEMLRRQIELVGGSTSRIRRAAVARWRAISQTVQWINEDDSLRDIVASYRQDLQIEWRDRFDPRREDCKECKPDEKCAVGLSLLDWSHENAPREVRGITSEWNAPYLVRGIYQDLANELDVGWHPDYVAILSPRGAQP